MRKPVSLLARFPLLLCALTAGASAAALEPLFRYTRDHRMKQIVSLLAFFSFLLCALTARAQTMGNDSSCDISVTPAATLLLPYLEADLAQPAQSARTTLFTITNVWPQPQIARATIWTDLAYPLYTFDIFLTGYDVAAVNLRELLTTGRLLVLAPAPGANGCSLASAEPGPGANLSP